MRDVRITSSVKFFFRSSVAKTVAQNVFLWVDIAQYANYCRIVDDDQQRCDGRNPCGLKNGFTLVDQKLMVEALYNT